MAAEILLPVYVRILLQPLCSGDLPGHHAFQASLSRLARLSALPIRAGLGLERLHGCVCAFTPRHSPRTARDQVEKSGSGIESGRSAFQSRGLIFAMKSPRRRATVARPPIAICVLRDRCLLKETTTLERRSGSVE